MEITFPFFFFFYLSSSSSFLIYKAHEQPNNVGFIHVAIIHGTGNESDCEQQFYG